LKINGLAIETNGKRFAVFTNAVVWSLETRPGVQTLKLPDQTHDVVPTGTGGALEHILSVDVEDYFQVEAFAGQVGRDTWEGWPSRVVANTQRVLDLFDLHGAK